MNIELQAKARKLFLHTDLTKTEIAAAIGIPRRTLHHWIKEQNWEYQKQCASHMPVRIAEKCYHILSQYTDMLLSPEREGVLLSPKEADTIHKLTVTISKLKTRTTGENMEIFGNFIDHLRRLSPELAEGITPFVTGFLAAGAAAASSVPGYCDTRPSQAEADKELELDKQYAAEVHETAVSKTPVTPHQPVSIADRTGQVAQRRQSPPSYEDLLAHFRRQDEHIRHLFPTRFRPVLAAAA